MLFILYIWNIIKKYQISLSVMILYENIRYQINENNDTIISKDIILYFRLFSLSMSWCITKLIKNLIWWAILICHVFSWKCI